MIRTIHPSGYPVYFEVETGEKLGKLIAELNRWGYRPDIMMVWNKQVSSKTFGLLGMNRSLLIQSEASNFLWQNNGVAGMAGI